MKYLLLILLWGCVFCAHCQSIEPLPQPATTSSYFCPLHYNYTKATINTCPSCGRTLIPKKTGIKDKLISYVLKFSLSSFVQAAYHRLIFPAILQGFILGVFLLIKARFKTSPHFFLACLLLSFSLFNLFFYGVEISILPRKIAPLLFPRFFVFAIGPLLLFYLKSLVLVDFKFTKKELLHFLPIVGIVLPGVILGPFSSNSVQRFLVENVQLIGMGFWLFYLPACWRLANHRKLQKRTWIKALVRSVVLVWACWLGFILIDIILFDFRMANPSYYFVWLLVSFFVYGIGIVGFQHSTVFHLPTTEFIEKTSATKARTLPVDLQPQVDQLTNLMNLKKTFLDAELTLESLANMMGIHPKTLSQVLNVGLQQNFYDFVNAYRIREAKKMLLDRTYSHLNILGIALECGFNSKPTFNRAFRKFVNMSPSEFKATQKSEVKAKSC